jgi:hypothetical protein
MDRLSAVLLIAATPWLAGCAGMRVDTDFDPQASFASLRAYDWMDSAGIVEDPGAVGPFLERRVRRAVDQALRARGFVYRAEGEPEFLLTAFVVAPERVAGPRRPVCDWPVVSLYLGWGHPYRYAFGYPWYRWPYPYIWAPWGYACAYRIGFGYTWLPVYERPGGRLPGTLVIDIYACGSGELIWRGWAEGALVDLSGRDEAALLETVTAILARFPPR